MSAIYPYWKQRQMPEEGVYKLQGIANEWMPNRGSFGKAGYYLVSLQSGMGTFVKGSDFTLENWEEAEEPIISENK